MHTVYGDQDTAHVFTQGRGFGVSGETYGATIKVGDTRWDSSNHGELLQYQLRTDSMWSNESCNWLQAEQMASWSWMCMIRMHFSSNTVTFCQLPATFLLYARCWPTM